jgi:hypothetical protein
MSYSHPRMVDKAQYYDHHDVLEARWAMAGFDGSHGGQGWQGLAYTGPRRIARAQR